MNWTLSLRVILKRSKRWVLKLGIKLGIKTDNSGKLGRSVDSDKNCDSGESRKSKPSDTEIEKKDIQNSFSKKSQEMKDNAAL